MNVSTLTAPSGICDLHWSYVTAISSSVKETDQKFSWLRIRSMNGRGCAKLDGAFATGDTKAVVLTSISRDRVTGNSKDCAPIG